MIDTVAILDAGSQFSKLIDRKVRELKVRTEILPLSTTASTLYQNNYKSIIISGGPGSVSQLEHIPFDSDIFQLNIPILGICYGMQLIVKLYNGVVEPLDYCRQDGQINVSINSSSLLYESIPNYAKVLLTHGDICTEIPMEFNCDVKSQNEIICGISHRTLPIFGVQYHPEVALTEIGGQLFENFLFRIANCKPEFTMNNRLDDTILEIRNFVSNFDDNYHLLVLLSGGVDSLVCGTIVGKALPTEKVHLVHIDHGFMRYCESQSVEEQLKAIGMNLKVYKCEREFLWAKTSIISKYPNDITQYQQGIDSNDETCVYDPYEIILSKPTITTTNIMERQPTSLIKVDTGPLCTIVDPEQKRKIIGDTFMIICKKIMLDLNLNPEKTIIAQGTLRPDLIESASKIVSSNAETIKTHHNDTEMVRILREKGLILEPLKDFHKDEVRKLGIELGLDKYLVNRHPFPGPGLAIRILCNGIAESTKNVDKFAANQVLLNYMVNYHLCIKMKRTNAMFDEIKTVLTENELSYLDEITSVNVQDPLFCHILPVNTVGIQGDCRSYKHPVVISSDNVTPNWESLMELTKFITKTCHNINRVVYAFGGRITDKVIDRLTLCHLSPPIIEILRDADRIVNDTLIEFNDYMRINQMPVILLPVQFDNTEFNDHTSMQFSVVLRPVITNDFMTALPAVPGVDISTNTLHQIQTRIVQSVPRISRVLYDLTGKPPATIEWE